jgi:hypothetical protein
MGGLGIMSIKKSLLGIIFVLGMSAGCSMCCHPYDYLGPVQDGCGCGSCGCGGRAGSILAGGSPDMAMVQSDEQASEKVAVGSVKKTARAVRTRDENTQLTSTGDRRVNQRRVVNQNMTAQYDEPSDDDSNNYTARRVASNRRYQ